MRDAKSGLSAFETATWELENSQTGQKVSLVGMMHVGDESYFQETAELLEGLSDKGYDVHYERLMKASDARVAAIPEAFREDFERLRASIKASSQTETASALRLHHQKDKLVYPSGAENIDFSDLDVFRALGFKKASRLFEPLDLQGVSVDAARRMLVLTFRLRALRSVLDRLTPKGRAVKRVILDGRNDHAVRHARRALKDSNIALVWGAEHLPGLFRGLQADGFQLKGVSWRRVCEI